MQTGFLWDERYMWHDTGHYAGVLQADPSLYLEPDEHNENPRTKRRFKNLLDASGYIDKLSVIRSREATMEEILRVHAASYVESLKALSADQGGDAGGLTPFGKGGWDLAALSAGGCLAMAQAIMEGQVKNGYVLNRPPGHHALADTGMGFCLLNNGAITARALQQDHGCERIAIVDWDVHHGNGAESIFWSDPSVLTLSIHQDNCFPPDSGAVGDIGEGAGEGYNLNVPLPPGSGRGAYLEAFAKVIIPALEAFRPDFIIVASGFDAGAQDPLGRNMLYSSVYAEMTAQLVEAADTLCSGRLMMTHEGGYNPSMVPFCGLAVLEALSGLPSGVEDPFLPIVSGMGYQDCQPHQMAVIEQAVQLVHSI